MPYAKAMSDIYTRLSAVGMEAAYVRKHLLPVWWEDKMAAEPVQRQYIEVVLSRQLGIRGAVLRDRTQPLQFSTAVASFKSHRNTSQESVLPALAVARRAADLAVQAMPPQELRLNIIEADSIRSSAEGPVNLGVLLAAAWSAGIPVLRMPRLPKGSGKVDGMALNIGGRPVVVVSTARKSAAWLQWILAHELGHVSCGHVAKGDTLDVSLADLDGPDEDEANDYAEQVLFGSSDRYLSPYRLPGKDIHQAAVWMERERGIDAGAIITNYGYSMAKKERDLWGAVHNALARIPSDATGAEQFRAACQQNLDLDLLGDDDADTLERLADFTA